MGIRFNRIKSIEVESDNDRFLATVEDKSAVLVGGSNSKSLTVYRFDDGENITKKSIITQFTVKLNQNYLEMRKYESIIVAYAANKEGSVAKFTVDSESQRQSFSSSSAIQCIVNHPKQNSLVILNKDEVYIMESNTNIPISVQNTTASSSKMLYETLNDVNELFVATIEGQSEEKAYLKVRKVQEIDYPSTYSAEQTDSVVIGVWNTDHSFTFQSARYFKKPKVTCFTIHESTPSLEIYYTLFFNENFKKVDVEHQLEKAKVFMVSQSEDRMVIQEDDEKICSYDYALDGTNLDVYNQNCLQYGLEKQLLDQLLHIEGTDYPVIKESLTILKAYSWDLKQVKIQYALGQDVTALAKPDGLLELTKQAELIESDIVPISVGGIIGLVFGSIAFCAILVLLICLFKPKFQQWREQKRLETEMATKTNIRNENRADMEEN